jgi:serine/threonine-protein kinase
MSAIEEGRVIASRYRLERLLARGGMGSVWVARHLKLDSTLAIKFIDPELAQLAEARGRFEREAKVAAQLQGPNLVQIHDYGIDDGTPYMVMEYLHGEDLCARLNREKRLSLEAAADIVVQVAKVLRRAHEAGIVHRDLKPGNVFLVRGEDEEDTVKLLDFGLAKIPQSASVDEMTQTGTLLGSPRYMSPEQARARKNIDHRSDLWSLAVIAFRAVTGALPFPGDEIVDVLMKICTAPVPAPSSIDPALGPAIDRFFARAFQQDPARRFQSARDFSREFVAATTGRAPLLSSSPARMGPVCADPARADEAGASPIANTIRTGARLSWIGSPAESPAVGNLSSPPLGSRAGPRLRGLVTAVTLGALAASVGLLLRDRPVKDASHPPEVGAGTAILAESIARVPPAPTVIADAPLPPSAAPAIAPAPDPTIPPALPRPAGSSPTAAPRSAPKAPSTKRKNSILGI